MAAPPRPPPLFVATPPKPVLRRQPTRPQGLMHESQRSEFEIWAKKLYSSSHLLHPAPICGIPQNLFFNDSRPRFPSWVPPHVWIDSCSEIMLKTNCPRFEHKAYERMYAFPFCVSTVARLGTRWCRCASGGERSSLLMTLGPPSIHWRRISLGT